jgi:PPK2 family polyphosphate:nucleotide phosphotransferase
MLTGVIETIVTFRCDCTVVYDRSARVARVDNRIKVDAQRLRFIVKYGPLIKRFRIENPKHFNLADHDPGEIAGFEKEKAERIAVAYTQRMTDLQQRLYAEHNWALLIILQGVDAAGKDSAIKRVMAGLNPQGCVVHPFKVPTAEESDHDFLWRAVKRLPARGSIGIFNRSYYEEVLVVRVHQELLRAQKLPPELITRHIWEERFADINAFERHLLRNGTVVIKFQLHISKNEQRRRLLGRLNDPSKFWKADMADVTERTLWSRYMAAYEDMIRNTSTAQAPWYLLPADHKWFARTLMAIVIVDVLDRLHLDFPKLDRAGMRQLQRMRKALQTG